MSTPPTATSAAPATAALPAVLLRGLSDKFYEKRKAAALEVERLVREAMVANDRLKVQRIIDALIQDFAYSVTTHSRNGGLIGLAAVAIAVGTLEIASFLHDLVPPVLACLADQDCRVRYYACESMYNIVKVARGRALVYFNEIFDSLSKLAADPELSVKNGADLLDRLIKDIVAEYASAATVSSPTSEDLEDPLRQDRIIFSLPRFIPLLSERIYSVNPFTRSFLVSWLSVLDSLPELELISYLPDFLDGLLGFVSDANSDVRVGAINVLGEFLREIRVLAQKGSLPEATVRLGEERGDRGKKRQTSEIKIPFGRLIQILLPHTRSKEEETQAIALTWLSEFLLLAKEEAVQFIPDLLRAILPCLAHGIGGIRRSAETCDVHLRPLVMAAEMQLDYPGVILALTQQFLHEQEKTRVTSLEWLVMLHQKAPMEIHAADIFPALLKLLSDPSDEVVKQDLCLLAQMSVDSKDSYFTKTIASLLRLFSTDRRLLEGRGSLIVRTLCIHLDPEQIYRKLAEILERDTDKEFSSTMVQNLNLILVTSSELAGLRNALRHGREDHTEEDALFDALYRSWRENTVAAFTLCLLAEAYEKASALLQVFAEVEISVNLLVQMDKLVQLLESPVFTYLRLQLLEPQKYPDLYKCLYGVLMVLPQSSAFATLRNRLSVLTHFRRSKEMDPS